MASRGKLLRHCCEHAYTRRREAVLQMRAGSFEGANLLLLVWPWLPQLDSLGGERREYPPETEEGRCAAQHAAKSGFRLRLSFW